MAKPGITIGRLLRSASDAPPRRARLPARRDVRARARAPASSASRGLRAFRGPRPAPRRLRPARRRPPSSLLAARPRPWRPSRSSCGPLRRRSSGLCPCNLLPGPAAARPTLPRAQERPQSADNRSTVQTVVFAGRTYAPFSDYPPGARAKRQTASGAKKMARIVHPELAPPSSESPAGSRTIRKYRRGAWEAISRASLPGGGTLLRPFGSSGKEQGNDAENGVFRVALQRVIGPNGAAAAPVGTRRRAQRARPPVHDRPRCRREAGGPVGRALPVRFGTRGVRLRWRPFRDGSGKGGGPR